MLIQSKGFFLLSFLGALCVTMCEDANQMRVNTMKNSPDRQKAEIIKDKLKSLIKAAKNLQNFYKRKTLLSRDVVEALNSQEPVLIRANCTYACLQGKNVMAEDLDFLSRVIAVLEPMIQTEAKSTHPARVRQKQGQSSKSKNNPVDLVTSCKKAAEAALSRLQQQTTNCSPSDCGLPSHHNWTTALLPVAPSFAATSDMSAQRYVRHQRYYVIVRDVIRGAQEILSHYGKNKKTAGQKRGTKVKGVRSNRKTKDKGHRQNRKSINV